MDRVHITVCMHGTCLCTLSASACIEPSLHQLDFFLEIFYGHLFLIAIYSCSIVKGSSLGNNLTINGCFNRVTSRIAACQANSKFFIDNASSFHALHATQIVTWVWIISGKCKLNLFLIHLQLRLEERKKERKKEKKERIEEDEQ